jgi:hypothetical protein
MAFSPRERSALSGSQMSIVVAWDEDVMDTAFARSIFNNATKREWMERG